MENEKDPTKTPEFQKVIRHFVTTPHKPHEPLKGVPPNVEPEKKEKPATKPASRS
jgi:hypothetical protein